jgi:chaperone modulatory protein CbpM
MSTHFTESETIAAVSRLTSNQLSMFVSAQIIRPLHTETGPVYRRVDLARLELLCDLCEDFDLEIDALCMVITLVDRLHDTRSQLRAVLEAVRAQPEDVHQRIAAAIHDATSTP